MTTGALISMKVVLRSGSNVMFKHVAEKRTDLKGTTDIKYSTVVSFLPHSSSFLCGSGVLLCL